MKFSNNRRRLIAGIGAAALAGTARSQNQFHYRLGLSQPLDSPNHIRLKEMAERVAAETGGRMRIDVHGAGALGSDNPKLAMVQKGAPQLYIAGDVLGPLLPETG